MRRKELRYDGHTASSRTSATSRWSTAARSATSTASRAANLLIVATDRISAFDVRAAHADPRQGRGPHPALELLVRQDGAASSPTTSSTATRFAGDAAKAHLRGPLRGRARAPARCRSRRSCAATSPARAARSTARRARSAASRCRRAWSSRAGCREPIFTPSTKAEAGTHDENISFEATATLLGEEAAAEVRDAVARALPVRRRLRARARHHHRRHQVRVRPRRRAS